MSPVEFPEANARLGAPEDLAESQCMTIPDFVGKIEGGSVDGAKLIVVAWEPTPDELARLRLGARIYLSVIGGLPPHFLSTSFVEATHPA